MDLDLYERYETELIKFMQTGDIEAMFSACALAIALDLDADLGATGSESLEGQDEAA